MTSNLGTRSGKPLAVPNGSASLYARNMDPQELKQTSACTAPLPLDGGHTSMICRLPRNSMLVMAQWRVHHAQGIGLPTIQITI